MAFPKQLWSKINNEFYRFGVPQVGTCAEIGLEFHRSWFLHAGYNYFGGLPGPCVNPSTYNESVHPHSTGDPMVTSAVVGHKPAIENAHPKLLGGYKPSHQHELIDQPTRKSHAEPINLPCPQGLGTIPTTVSFAPPVSSSRSGLLDTPGEPIPSPGSTCTAVTW